MIVRIGTVSGYGGWRYRVATWLRNIAHRFEPQTTIILCSDNAGLKMQCIHGCTRMFVQAQAMDFAREHADDIRSMEMASQLQAWEPDAERMQ